jgi:multidrug efflux pump subunit AcrB
MNLAELTIQRRTLSLVLTVVLLVGGLIAYRDLGRLEDPEYTIKTAVVMTSYPGATPHEVEEEVTDIVETAIQQMGQVDEVRSLSRAGQSIIYVDIKDHFGHGDLPQVWDELRRKVNDVAGQLPPGVEAPVVRDDFGDVYGVFFALTGQGYSAADLKEYADLLKRELLLATDVAKVDFWGVQPEAVYVEFSRSRMSELGLMPEAIYGTLQQQNVVADAGRIEVGEEYVRIDPTGLFQSVDEIGELLIRGYPSESLVRLKDIAEIRRGYVEPPFWLMRYNSEPALGVGISTVSGGNVVTMGDAVRERLAELEPQAPIGMQLNEVYFQADHVEKAVDGFVINLVESLIIVIGLLMIFMGMRSGLLIGGILLLTIAGTFVMMDMFGIDLQRISLGALIVALGMLVDNAIVVTEGILIRLQSGSSRLVAATASVKDTKWPLLGATVVAICAFAGIGLSNDSTGEFLRALFHVVAISLLLSWVLAVTITPLIATMFLSVPVGKAGTDPYGGRFYSGYRKFLGGAIDRRWLSMALVAGALVLGIFGFTRLETSFFPNSSKPFFFVDYWRAEGTHIRHTADDLARIEQYVRSQEEVESVATFVGQGATRFMLTYSAEMPSTAYGQLVITLKDYELIEGFIPGLQTYLEDNYPNAEPRIRRLQFGPGDGMKVEARFLGPDPTILRKLANQAKDIMRQDPLAKDIRDDWRQKVKVIRPQFSEARARHTGVSRVDLNRALSVASSGATVGVYREGNDLLPIITRPPAEERGCVDTLGDVQVVSPLNGRPVPLHQVVDALETEWQDATIRRQNRVRTITAQSDPRTGNASALFASVRPQIEAIELPPGYKMEWGGEYEHSTEAQQKTTASLPLTLTVMVLITIALFNSLRQPLIIFLCIPLATIGVAAGLLLTGMPYSFMAFLGLLSLMGMLIKNAVVLIDQIDTEIIEGRPHYHAILHSAVSRVRPVMMASMTTVLGMFPLMFDPFFAGMAVTIMFGLSFATVLTLVIVPVFYAIFFRIHAPEVAA